MNKIIGKLIWVSPIHQVGQSGSTKRNFWLDTTNGSSYPNYTEFELWGQNVDLVDDIKDQTELEVTFVINGRKWQDKNGDDRIFNTVRCVGITAIKREKVGSTNGTDAARSSSTEQNKIYDETGKEIF
jgi:hypothetical protein